jgi:hypothetical protein
LRSYSGSSFQWISIYPNRFQIIYCGVVVVKAYYLISLMEPFAGFQRGPAGGIR